MQKLRVSYTAGVTPGKWIERFTERYPEIELVARREDYRDVLDLLANDEADAVFLRYQGASPKDATRHVIPLYEELEVLCAAKDHDIEYYEESIPAALAASFPQLNLADYTEEVGGLPIAMEVVASGAQVARMPQSLARLFHRKDVIYRLIEEATPTNIGIAWSTALEDTEVLEEFIGIVRGRRASSSRQSSVRAQEQQAKKINDKKKAKAKAKSMEAAKKAKQLAKKQPAPKGRKRR